MRGGRIGDSVDGGHERGREGGKREMDGDSP